MLRTVVGFALFCVSLFPLTAIAQQIEPSVRNPYVQQSPPPGNSDASSGFVPPSSGGQPMQPQPGPAFAQPQPNPGFPQPQLNNTFAQPPGNGPFPPAQSGVPSGIPSVQPNGGLPNPGIPNGGPATAAPAASGEAPAVGSVSKELVQQKLQAVTESATLAEEVKTELSKRYNKALEWLKSADESIRKAAAYDAEIRQGSSLISRAKADLAAPLPDPVPSVSPEVEIVQLEQTLTEVEALVKAARDDLAKREDEIKRRTERTTELAKLIAETRQRLEETRQQPATAIAVEGDAVAEAKRMETVCRVLALEKQLLFLQTESRRYEALAELFPLQRDVAKRVLTFREKEVKAWHKLVGQRRKEESERQAREARRQVENAHPAFRSLAERNAVLAELRQALTASIESASKDRHALGQQNRQLLDDYDKITEKVTRAGHSATVGLMLRKMRDDLPSRHQFEERLRFIHHEMPMVHLRLLELKEERETLGDIDTAAKQVIADLDASVQQFAAADLDRLVTELLQSKRDLLDKLTTDHEAYLRDLSELELANKTLDDTMGQVTDYVDEHVLWIRSTDPLGLAQLQALLPAAMELAHPQQWLYVVQQTGADALRQPHYAALMVLIGIALFTLRRRLLLRLRVVCEAASGHGALKFLPTLEGLFVSAVLSAQWPTIMLYVGWRLAASETATGFSRAVAVALINVAALFWMVELVRHIMRAGGVAETHFNWPVTTLRGVRAHMRWLTLLGLPLVFVTVVCLRIEDRDWANGLGRAGFIVAMLMLAGFFHTLFYPKGRVFREMQVANPKGWLVRFRHLVYGLSAAAPLALAILATVGYFYSAQQLALRIQLTVMAMIALLIAHAVLSRWFLIKRRNLAMEQARQRRSEAQAASALDGSTSGGAPPVPERDLSVIHEQLRYLLRYAVTGCVLVAGWLIWSDVLPALRVFDRVVIWEHKIEVTDTIEGANGMPVTDTHEEIVPTTLRHAMLAVLLIVVTYLLGQKLPALLEITILDRLPIDHGGRHAVSMLVRYVVALVGVLLACRTMSISWSSVQWLAAAMTVGLGFGLQEIFANLVSGLIILFERPIRVGDIVTVGTVTGTVSQMRMRATTVLDFDRRELIVPNKKFITDDVINWTLSDPISRVVLPVGIAYGSDTALAQQLLLKAAREHPTVLTEPPPSALFKGFGDSTLDFDLRVFIPNRDVYPVVLHDLNSAIDRLFREAEIEIAFPQRDLHVRSISQILPLQQLQEASHRADAA